MRRDILTALAVHLMVTICVLMLNVQLHALYQESSIIVVPDNYSSIQKAINAANEGDRIFVKAGIYYMEQLVVNKTLSLLGENPETTVIDGQGSSLVLVSIAAPETTFENFTIQNTASTREAYGISLFRSEGARVQYNIVKDCWFGILLSESTNCEVWNNKISHNHLCGILLRDECSNNSILGNSISNNPTGINVMGSSWYTDIYHNNLINNEYQIFMGLGGHTSWDNGCEGNYWSDFEGIDLDGDGIGDTELPWQSVDYYPLIDPFWNPGDVNHDSTVDSYDVVLVCGAYGTTTSDLNWNGHCDIAQPFGKINIYDVVLICTNYGEEYNR